MSVSSHFDDRCYRSLPMHEAPLSITTKKFRYRD